MLRKAPHTSTVCVADARDAKMLQPEYTMNGLGVHDEMRANGSVHNRVLGVLLKQNLELLQPRLQNAIAASFAKFATGPIDAQSKFAYTDINHMACNVNQATQKSRLLQWLSA